MTLKTKTLFFAVVFTTVVLTNLTLLRQLLAFSLENEYASHIVLIPFMSAMLILRKRAVIFSSVGKSILMREGASIIAIVLLVAAIPPGNGSTGTYEFSFRIISVLALVVGGFLVSYGPQSFSRACFPLFLLFLMVPFPDTLVSGIVLSLQKGSAETVSLLFKLIGTPFHRDGFTFLLPRISMEIASQCSGIRSSLALFICCLLAAHLLLKTPWRKLVFVLVAIPMAMFKNAVRIVVLYLLAVHVDMQFLIGGDLHRKGGILFFLLALVLMMPILWILRRYERNATAVGDQP